MWWLLLLSLSALAQEDLNLDAVRDLDLELPATETHQTDFFYDPSGPSKYPHINNIVTQEQIEGSPTEIGSIQGGVSIVRIEDNKVFRVPRNVLLKFYRLEDEQGFKYLVNKEGKSTFKITGDYVTPISQETALYEAPLIYTPAPLEKPHQEYDKKLKLRPEAIFYTGFVRGQFIRDLFNDPAAKQGTSNHYSAQAFTDWKLPLKVGLAFHYERATYNLTGGGRAYYSSPSIGPLFKTPDFELFGERVRLEAQYRISPFATITGETQAGASSFRFNSSDFLLGLEHPIRNRYGEFLVGFFYQAQWLSIRRQTEGVSVRASNGINQSFGLSLGQVF